MSARSWVRISAPAWLLLIVAGAAHAQGAEPLPVSVAAAPAVVAVQRPVTLSGTSISAASGSVVVLRITRPAAGNTGASTATMNAPLDLAGSYSVVFSATATATPGIYKVHATAPDGEGIADTSFRVADALSAAADTDAVAKVAPTAAELLTILRQKVENLPPSPAKDELVRDMGELDRRMLSFQRDAAGAATDIRVLLDVSGRQALPPKLAAERDALLSALGKAEEWINRTPAEEAQLKRESARCDSLEVVAEGFKFVSFLLNFAAGGPVDIAQNFLGDLVGYAYGKGADAAGTSDRNSFLISEGGKNAAGQLMALKQSGKIARLGAVTGSIVGNVSDLYGYTASQAIKAYCEQFTGPVTAHMKAEFYQDGVKWWEYSFDLRGRLTVHYPKDAAGSSIPLKGRLEGYAHGFKVWENAMTVLYPNLMSSAVQKRILIPPPELGLGGAAIGTEYVEGSVVGAAGLNAFFFEVTGTAQKDKLILQVGAARTDIDAKARVIVFSLSPLSLSIADNSYALPFKPAHFIFERTAGVYTIDLNTVGKTIRGKQHFENEVRRSENVGRYSVDIEACNPSC